MQAVLRDLISRGDAAVPCLAMLDVLPQLVGNRGLAGLKRAIADPERYAIEPKVDGVRGLLAFLPDGTIETRNRHVARRDWLRADGFRSSLRRLAQRLPILWDGTVLDGELIVERFAGNAAVEAAGDSVLSATAPLDAGAQAKALGGLSLSRSSLTLWRLDRR